MKKSTAVTLVLSGAMMAGCGNRPNGLAAVGPYRGAATITNNTYVTGQGYWHAPYQGWFPYPYNSFHEGYGYYHGGSFSETPEVSSITASAPADGSGLAAQGIVPEDPANGTTVITNTIITNNTYVTGMGYWHAPYHGWFPYPFNYYRPGFGYYHGGIFSSAPLVYSPPITSSGHWSGSPGGGSFGGSDGHVSSISRGGFGGSAHGAGS